MNNACNPSGGFGAAVDCLRLSAPGGSLESVIDSIVNVLLFGAVIAAGLFLIWGGIRYITSGGNQNRVTDAKNTILYAILGLIIAFVALGVVTFIGGTLQA